MTNDECLQLARGVLDGRLWEVRSKRPTGVRHESRPSMEFSLRGEAGFTVNIWAREVDELPSFATVRQTILGIAKRISKDKVTY